MGKSRVKAARRYEELREAKRKEGYRELSLDKCKFFFIFMDV